MIRKLSLLGALSTLAMAPAAMASVTCTSGNYNCTITPNSSVLPTATTPGAYFTVSGNPFVGDVSGSFGRSGLKAGTFTDLFTFTLGQTGIGSGSVTTNFAGNILSAATNLDFTGVWFNNGTTTYDLMPFLTHTGNREDTGIDNVPITTGVLNTITVSYLARGNGSYSGTLQFTPTVPEPATWALLMAGFGVLGFALRRSRRETVRVRYAF